MTSTEKKNRLLEMYLPKLQELAPEAKEAYGSRSTESRAHTVSREYTNLLAEYATLGGSLLKMAKELDTSYPALRRRVMTANLTPLPRTTRSKALPAEYARASERLKTLKTAPTIQYHDAIREEYENGLSLNKLATYMGLKSAYPLYYGLNKSRMRNQ